ncbi:MAG: LysR family transcriptional regulator [Chloroflexi bacterium]|nr:LysR family transcriptional regulator [Chloroflexota bacterium]
MDLNRLRLFSAVAEHGSYSRAAEALDLSQPSVSVQVHQLERALSAYLFFQVGRKLHLTEEGKLLLGYAHQIFSLEERAEQAVQELSSLERGHLVVGASFTIGNYMLPPVLREFQQQYPGVELVLELGNTQEIQERMLDNELDVAFVGRVVDHPQIRSAPYSMDHLVVIASAGHPLGNRSLVSVQELTEEPFVIREKGSATRDLVESRLHALGTDYRVSMEAEGPEAVKQAVAAGLGVSVISRTAVAWEAKAGRLSLVNVPELDLHRQLYQVLIKSRPVSRAAQAFMGLVSEHNEHVA